MFVLWFHAPASTMDLVVALVTGATKLHFMHCFRVVIIFTGQVCMSMHFLTILLQNCFLFVNSMSSQKT